MDAPAVEDWKDPEIGYLAPTDPSKVNFGALHAFLSNHSHWAKGITMESVRKATSHSLPFSLISPEGEFAVFARFVTDYTCIAYK